MTDKRIQQLYVAGGLINIVGMLVFSKVFSNIYLTMLDVIAFSNPSVFLIMLWGGAYISIANKAKSLPWLSLIFSIEKFVYVGNWLMWMYLHSKTIPTIFEKDFITGIFFTTYGINDLAFALLFLYVYAIGIKNKD